MPLWLIVLFLLLPGRLPVVAEPLSLDREIYIPQSELGNLPQSASPAILLTRSEYQNLLAGAYPYGSEAAGRDAVPAAFESAVYEATAVAGPGGKGDCLDVRAVFSLRVLSATWSEVPFDFAESPPLSIRVDGRWIVTTREGEPARLFVYGAGAHEVIVRFLAKAKKDPARNRIDLPIPAASSGIMQIRFPGRQEVESPLPVRVSRTESETLALVALGGARRIQVSWSPSGEGGGRNAEFPLFVESHLAYAVEESLVQITGTLLYNTLAGDLPLNLSFTLPEGASVRELSGAGAANWRVADQTVTVDRVPGQRDSLELSVIIEAPFETGPRQNLPLLSIPGAFRHYGELAVVGARGLRLRLLEKSQAEMADASVFFGESVSLPGQFLAAFRFFAEPVTLFFEAQRVAPEMEATVGAWVEFRNDAAHLQRYVELFQKKGESHRVTFMLPRDEVIVKILDKADREAEYIASSSGERTHIRIDLPGALSSGDASAFTVVTQIFPPGYAALDETGVNVTLAALQVEEATRLSGTLALGVRGVLRLTDLAVGDLETAPRPAEHPGAAQAFFFRNDYNLTLRVSRRPSEVDALVLLDLLPKQGFLSVQGEVQYAIRNAGRKEFSVAFPKGLGNTFHIDGGGIMEREMVSDEKWDRWDLTLQDDRIGTYTIQFRGDLPMNGEIAAPEVWIPGVRRERGYILTEANTETEIEFYAEGLGTADVLDVPKLSSYNPEHRLIAAYRYFVHPWSLRLKVTRHEAEPVLRIIADRLDLTTLMVHRGPARSRAIYSLRGVRTAFLTVSLPPGSSLWSALAGSQPVKPMAGGTKDGEYLIPIGDRLDRNNPLAVELVYETVQPPFNNSGRAELLAPRLGGGIPVQETHWTLYLPDGYAYSGIESDLRQQWAPRPEPLVLAGISTLAGIVAGPNYQRARVPASSGSLNFPLSASDDTVTQLQSLGYGGGGPVNGVDNDGDGVVDVDVTQVDRDGRPQPQALQTPVVQASSLPDDPFDQPQQEAREGQPPPGATVDGFGSAHVSSSILPINDDSGSFAFGVVDATGAAIPSVAAPFAGAGVAGILPFQINLLPQDIERHSVRYAFRDLKEGEHVALRYRKLESWNARGVFLTVFAGLLFAAWVRNRGMLKSTLWALFILTALPYVLGRNWSGFCNQILIGILLADILVIVLRLRVARLGHAAATAILLLGLGLGSIHRADAAPVYVPYDANHPESATGSSRVLVPHDRFQELWNLAKAHQRSATEITPPAPYSLDDAEYDITLAGGVAAIDARYRLYLPRDGWVKVDLPFSGANIGTMTVDGAAARTEQSENGYRIHLREKGEHVLRVQMTLRTPETLTAGSLSLGIPPTFASRVRIVLPRADLTAEIGSGTGGRIETIAGDQKVILAGLRRSNRLELNWRPEAARAGAADGAQAASMMNANITIQHSVVGLIENWTAAMDLAFAGEKRAEFNFALDPSLTLTAMEVPNLSDWTITEETGRRALRIRLLEAAGDSLRVVLTGERRAEGPSRSVPIVAVAGARQTATRAVLSSAPWLDLRVDAAGFRRIADTESAIAGLRSAGTFESEREGDRLNYLVEERPQEIHWKLDYLFQVESRKIEAIVSVNADIKRRPLFGLAIQVPEGYRCENVSGESVKDWWETPGGAGTDSRVDVEFNGGLIGKSHLIVHLIRQYAEQPETLSVRPIRLSTTGDQAEARIEGSVLIATHVSVEPRPVGETGLQSTTLCGDEAGKRECKVGGGLEVTLPLQKKLAYWFESPDFSAEFRLEQVEPRFAVTWTTLAETHETWVSYSTHIAWQLRRGSRRTWEFDAPASLGEIAVTGDRVREVSYSDRGDARHYIVQLDSEVFGEDALHLSFETPIQESALVPHLGFPGADRVSGYILTGNESPFELSAEPSGSLKSAQISDVPYLPAQYGVLGYYKVYEGDWDLNLRLVRTVAAETLAAVIDWIDLETHVRRDGSTLNRARIRMQNKTLQFLPVRLPERAQLLSLFVANEAVGANRAVRNGQDVHLVPLIKTAIGDLSYEVEIDYETRADQRLGLTERLDVRGPEIPGIPVGQTFWTFRFPEEYGIHRIGGNMEETTTSLLEASKLYAREEERQRLKGVLTGSYDLKKKERALSNYLAIEQEISSSNESQQREFNVQQELVDNPRLQNQARILEEAQRRFNQTISSNIKADQSGELRTQLEGIRQQVLSSKEALAPAMEGEKSVNWASNGAFIADAGLPQAAPEAVQAPVSMDEETAYTKVGANVYIAREAQIERPAGGADDYYDKDARAGERDADTLLNIGRAQQQKGYEYGGKSEAKPKSQAWDLFSLRKGKPAENAEQQRVGGRFKETEGSQGKGRPKAGDIPEFRIIEPSVEQAALGTPAIHGFKGIAQAPVEVAKIEGIYSIPISFPQEGRIITFKKLKAGAAVRFTLLDRVVPMRAKRIVITAIAAALFWLVLLLLNRKRFWRFLRGGWPYYGIVPGLLLLPFNPGLAVLLLLTWLVAVAVRQRLNKRREAAWRV